MFLRGEMQSGEDFGLVVLVVVLYRSRLALDMNVMCAAGSPFLDSRPALFHLENIRCGEGRLSVIL